ncbi:MAG: hypothetical protein NTAFB01_14150 [Nitrospira sp.]
MDIIRSNTSQPSHHQVVAWLIEHQRLLWATLRTSHAMTANGVMEFLAKAPSMLPPGHRIGLIRTDAYFCVTTFSRFLDARDLPYIIATRLTTLAHKLVILRILESDWRSSARWIAVADMTATFLS